MVTRRLKLFPFIGIMADQEPRRSFTPSGTYNTALFESGDSVEFTADIVGASEFSFLMWLYPTSNNQYVFKTSDNSAFLQIKSDGKLRFQILNTNMTNSVVESSAPINLNVMQMVTVTGSLSNGLSLYINDGLNNTGAMPANNDVIGKTWSIGTNLDGSLSLFRSWSREIQPSEVEELYAYDDDLLLQGGVSVSAMTTDQKVDLEIAIEMAQDIPYDSDEFDDRSENKIAVINNGVTLAGEQLQVYTDENDIPSGTQVFLGSALELDGINQQAFISDDASISPTTDASMSIWVFVDVIPSTTQWLINKSSDIAPNNSTFEVAINNAGQIYWMISEGSNIQNPMTTATSIVAGAWNNVVVVHDATATQLRVYINGVLDVNTGTTAGTIYDTAGAQGINLGARIVNNYLEGSLYGFELSKTVYNQSVVNEINNIGIPLCYESRATEPTGVYVRLGNYNGNNGDELTDLTANVNNIITLNSPTFTKEITIGCTS